MIRSIGNFSLLFLALALASCGGSQSAEPIPSTPKPVSDEPAFEIAGFAPLGTATTENALPYLSADAGAPVENACFARSKDSQLWETANPDVMASITANVLPIKSGIIHWLEKTFTDGSQGSGIGFWQVDIDELTVRHVGGRKVRLKEGQECFTTDKRSLGPNAKVVTTLFGAKKLLIKSKNPIPRPLIKKIKQKSKKQNIHVTSILTYKKAKDLQGKPIFQKGKPMFRAPDGTLVGKRKVPPPGKRPVYELEIKIPGVLNFAFGHMPNTYWKSESLPTDCNLTLIYDDIVPRVPDCASLRNIGFGVSEGDDIEANVNVKVSADGTTTHMLVPFGSTEMIQVGGRYLAWVTPSKEELGASLEVDTVILNQSKGEEELKQFKFGK